MIGPLLELHNIDYKIITSPNKKVDNQKFQKYKYKNQTVKVAGLHLQNKVAQKVPADEANAQIEGALLLPRTHCSLLRVEPYHTPPLGPQPVIWIIWSRIQCHNEGLHPRKGTKKKKLPMISMNLTMCVERETVTISNEAKVKTRARDTKIWEWQFKEPQV